MAADTTTPDGYLVAADGSWVTGRQELGNYVRTPYDNRPYFYDPKWQEYIFDEDTDYAWVNDTRVLAAVRGIIPVSELSEENRVVNEEVCRFLTGFDYGASVLDSPEPISFLPMPQDLNAGFGSTERICGMPHLRIQKCIWCKGNCPLLASWHTS